MEVNQFSMINHCTCTCTLPLMHCVYRWLHYVNEYGMCLVKGAPTQVDEVARVGFKEC